MEELIFGLFSVETKRFQFLANRSGNNSNINLNIASERSVNWSSPHVPLLSISNKYFVLAHFFFWRSGGPRGFPSERQTTRRSMQYPKSKNFELSFDPRIHLNGQCPVMVISHANFMILKNPVLDLHAIGQNF